MFDFLASIDLSFAVSLIERGGPVVIAIAILSIVALAVGAIKFLQFLRLGVGHNRAVERALKQWIGGGRELAITALAARRNPTACLLHHTFLGIRNGLAEATIREDAERLARAKLANLRSHLRVIEATAQITPLLGLFGTVLGMMGAFQALQSAGAEADPAALAGGIWTALITTAVGLAVAIPAGLAIYWFEGRIEKETVIMEEALTSVFTGRLKFAGSTTGVDGQFPSRKISTVPNATE